MNETILTVFVIATCVAVIIQMGILIGMFMTMKKSSERMEALGKRVEEKAIPVLESTRAILEDAGPKLKEITANLADVSGTIKTQVTRMDATFNDTLDRTRLQVIRVDELVSRTIDKVEETTEMVQHTVLTPLKQLTGVIQGLSVGVGSFLARRRKAAMEAGQTSGRGGDDEEMFI
jgi:methyl-accepting chemotaxis protein